MTLAERTPPEVFRQACRQLEDGPSDLRELLTLMVDLVAAALRLPEVEPDRDGASANPPDLDECSRQVATRVLDLVGPSDYYWELHDPREEAHPVGATLTDDVSDIYRDLRRGLHQEDLGSTNDALWEWRFSFETHWGNHATDAIRVLHRLVAD